MSAISDIAGKALSALGSGGQTKLLQLVTGLVTSSGGIDGLMKLFNDKGLGNIVSSWIGKEANLPISGDQIMQVFGANKIQDIAGQVGLTAQDASAGVAKVLPQIVDSLTPDGTPVNAGTLDQGISGLVKKGFTSLFG